MAGTGADTWNKFDTSMFPGGVPNGMPWTDFDQLMNQWSNSGNGDSNTPDQASRPVMNLDGNWLKSLGYANALDPGAIQVADGQGGDSGGGTSTSPQLTDWLKNNGYKFQMASTLAGTPGYSSKNAARLVDAQGKQVGDAQQWGYGNDDAFGLTALGATGFAAAAASGAFAGSGAFGSAAADGGLGSFSGIPAGEGGGASLGGEAASGTYSGLTLDEAAQYAKKAYSIYNTANRAANGDYLGALSSGLSVYTGSGGVDPTDGGIGLAQTGIRGYGTAKALENGNYLGAGMGAIGTYNGLDRAGYGNSTLNSAGSAGQAGVSGMWDNFFNTITGSNQQQPTSYDAGGYNPSSMFGSGGDFQGANLSDYGGGSLGNYGTNPYTSGSSVPTSFDYGSGNRSGIQGGAQDMGNAFGASNSIGGGVGSSPISGAGAAPATWQDYLKKNGGNIFGGLASLYMGHQQANRLGDARKQLDQLYSPNSPYAQEMRSRMMRSDAASGRRSQAGVREMQLAAQLTRARSGQLSSPGYQSLINGQTNANYSALGPLLSMYNRGTFNGLPAAASSGYDALSSYFGG